MHASSYDVKKQLVISKNCRNMKVLSLQVIPKAMSCKEFILLFRLLLWNIHTIEQSPNWGIVNDFITILRFFMSI